MWWSWPSTPRGILDFLKAYREQFKPGALVWDVCGVKSAILEAADCLPDSVEQLARPTAGAGCIQLLRAPPG